jgi:hypothetical protein
MYIGEGDAGTVDFMAALNRSAFHISNNKNLSMALDFLLLYMYLEKPPHRCSQYPLAFFASVIGF